jgi:23S rRNA pseudouridine955/2504/2580 synthase
VKTYHAVTNGSHHLDKKSIDLPLHIAASGMVRVAKSGKPSITVATSLRIYNTHTLVACKPVTGRMHQIRVHMAAIGAPLVADEMYGGEQLYLSAIKKKYRPKDGSQERPLMARVALHAYSLKFKDRKGEIQYIECPYPKDFQTIISQLERNT